MPNAPNVRTRPNVQTFEISSYFRDQTNQIWKQFHKNTVPGVETREALKFKSYGPHQKCEDDLYKQSEFKHLGPNNQHLIGPYRSGVAFDDHIKTIPNSHNYMIICEADAYWHP